MAGDSKTFLFTLQGATLCALATALTFGWLGDGSLSNGDDAVYAWAARAMVERGEWLSYRWHQAELHTYYPPVHFVLLKLSLLAFGPTEFAFRLPAALSALACALVTAHLTFDVSRSRNAGLLSGLLLLSSGTFYEASRSVKLDMTFLVFGVGAYWSYFRALRDARYLWLLGLFGGLAYLAKSVLVAFVGLPILVDVLLQRRDWFSTARLYGAACVAFAIAAPWHITLWLSGRPAFPSYGERVLHGIAGDFSFASMAASVARSEGYNLAFLASGALFLLFQTRRENAARFFAIAIGAGLAILLATKTAFAHYALSLFPPLTIGSGWLFGSLIDRRPVFTPVLVCVVLGLFATNNAAIFVNPDLAPGARDAAVLASEQSTSPVLVFREYSAAFDFYLNRQTLLLTESQDAYDLYVAHPAMKNGPGILLVTPEQMLVRLSDPSMQVATTLPFQKDLEGYLSRLPEAVRRRLERKRFGFYLLYRRGVQAAAAAP